MLPLMRDMLKEAIEIEEYEDDLNIILKVKPRVEIKGNLADPEEFKIMLHMFGGLNRDFPIDVQINDQEQTIYMKFQNKDDYEKVKGIMATIWDDTIDIFGQVLGGDFSAIQNIEDIDD